MPWRTRIRRILLRLHSLLRPAPNTIVLSGRYRLITRVPVPGACTYAEHCQGAVLSVSEYHNVPCVNGKNYIASWINQEIGTNPTIYGAVGTSTTTPLSTDTNLGAEVSTANTGRVALASQSRTGNQVTLDFFWTTSQGNVGQLNEAGVFFGGTITTNSGNLVSHTTISENKDATRTLTIEVTLAVGP